VSLDSDDHEPAREEDDFPRKGWRAFIPKRTLGRVLMLLAALAAIIYLREKTGAIAGCMSDAFRAPAPTSPASVKVRLAPPGRPLDASAR